MTNLDRWLVVYFCRFSTITCAVLAGQLSYKHAVDPAILLIMASAAFWVFGDLYAKEQTK